VIVTTPPDVDGLSYEQARDELVSVVAALEAGAVTLEESLELWERGEALAARCQHILQGARERIAGAVGVGDGPSPAAESDEPAE
jgi:exodeoxyribonuclease VII small subunit